MNALLREMIANNANFRFKQYEERDITHLLIIFISVSQMTQEERITTVVQIKETYLTNKYGADMLHIFSSTNTNVTHTLRYCFVQLPPRKTSFQTITLFGYSWNQNWSWLESKSTRNWLFQMHIKSRWSLAVPLSRRRNVRFANGISIEHQGSTPAWFRYHGSWRSNTVDIRDVFERMVKFRFTYQDEGDVYWRLQWDKRSYTSSMHRLYLELLDTICACCWLEPYKAKFACVYEYPHVKQYGQLPSSKVVSAHAALKKSGHLPTRIVFSSSTHEDHLP